MQMKKYLTSFSLHIKEVEISRETKHMVFQVNIRGGEVGSKKATEYSNYHDTWQDAKDFLVRKYTNKKARAEINLADAISELERVKSLTV
tara:strand:- start:58 stop:327 length:270 start_codon:yes stop_codon:yes gene_type:complete